MFSRRAFIGRIALNFAASSNLYRRYTRQTLASIQHKRISPYTTTATTTSNIDIVDSLPGPEDEINTPAPSSNGVVTIDGNGISTLIPEVMGDGSSTDWSRSYFGLSTQPFQKETAEILQQPLNPEDIEIKPGNSKVDFNIYKEFR